MGLKLMVLLIVLPMVFETGFEKISLNRQVYIVSV